jgi:hypothetical protein
MRQLLRHCCKAVIFPNSNRAFLDFDFHPFQLNIQETFIIPWRTWLPLYVSHFSVLLFFLLRSSLLCSILLSFLPILCFLLHSSHLWSVLLSFLPRLSHPPTLALSQPVSLVTTSSYSLSKLITARCRHVSGDRIIPITKSWLRWGREANKTKGLVSRLSLQGATKCHEI